jgi:hypothetical protein
MSEYELELVTLAKNRGDSITKQLADLLCKRDAEIEALTAENQRLFASMLTMALDDEIRKTQV